MVTQRINFVQNILVCVGALPVDGLTFGDEQTVLVQDHQVQLVVVFFADAFIVGFDEYTAATIIYATVTGC